MFLLSLFSEIRMTLMIIAAQSLGMGWDAPRGRIIIAYDPKIKGLQNVKENICGRSPPGGNTCCCRGFGNEPGF